MQVITLGGYQESKESKYIENGYTECVSCAFIPEKNMEEDELITLSNKVGKALLSIFKMYSVEFAMKALEMDFQYEYDKRYMKDFISMSDLILVLPDDTLEAFFKPYEIIKDREMRKIECFRKIRPYKYQIEYLADLLDIKKFNSY